MGGSSPPWESREDLSDEDAPSMADIVYDTGSTRED